ncbi:aromatic ring-opening dioxygenase LigA [Actinoplanes sichuanensis]|uniref:Aromatic ring-opening dioxygenase LigA n=1 Tax=Actinoplanes sichuanensis TaxID=512349 RepID=A0ABW4AWD2_9ACTN|nr:aromatic ring-opening dioxygenase LigA [Actinoplanes sichuanensis]
MAESRRGPVPLLGLLVLIAGAILIVAGVITYMTISSTLSAQQITVSEDAGAFAGQHVDQPWEAYAEAKVIAEHAGDIADGKTYAQLSRDDPNRETVMNASFLQASLFTSVVAFGVAALAAGIGIAFILIGVALRRTAALPAPAAAPTA